MASKDYYLGQKEQLERNFLADQDVKRYLLDHTRLVDSMVTAIVDDHTQDFGLALFATGGYGRRELFPSSDLDVLLVFEQKEKFAGEPIISAVLHDLWDTGLDIGHQVWSLEELRHLSLEQYQFALALLDIRPLTEDQPQGNRVQSEIELFLGANRQVLCRKLVELAENRHREFENTIYQLEPDLKLAPGGLRDIQFGKWLVRLLGSKGLHGFTETEIEDAGVFLKRLRILVHLLAGRNDNRLSHAMQERLRNYVGYRDVSAQAGVEALMKEYFLSARVSHSFCKMMLKAATKGIPAEPSVDEVERHAVKSMSTLLELFLQEEDLLDVQKRAISAALPSLSSSLHFPSLKEPIKALFRPRIGLYRSLSAMYELGVLELLFPEIGSIRARVVWDLYHRYTVDEHTLLAIRNVERLSSGNTDEDGRFKTLLADVVDPSLLTLALLFHDVGKGRGGQHSDQGARMAARALRRFRFEGEEIDTIAFLIQHHLAMSGVIFRRDLDDDQVISRFADLVGDPDILRLLTLLTYADIKAVAPGTLNEWKRDLLWQLYVATNRKLTLGYGEERLDEKEVTDRIRSSLAPEAGEADFERFVEGFPARYLQHTPPEEIYEHYRMAKRIDDDHPIQTRIRKNKEYYELCVVTPDRSFVFARIVGLLSYFEMNILRGHGFSNRQRTILDFFRFIDAGGQFRRIHEKTRFQELLDKAIIGEISVEKLLQGKEESVLFRRTAPGFEPSIYFEDEHSDKFTILEIVAPDALGLLYRISREISQLRCDIELALISTEGEKAVDVFYLCYEGSKLSAQLKENLSNRIAKAIR